MSAHAVLFPETSNSLALAIIKSSKAPLLLLDRQLEVVAASASFCRAFQIDARTIVGCPIASLGAGDWDIAQMRQLLTATISGYADIEDYEIDLKPAGRTPRLLVLNAQKLDYADVDNARLLMSIADVTAVRAAEKQKDDLLREKAILLQELQHRVANSLQIVASVLMQSARRVQSDEARSHLTDAHSRVMSIAALQQQLTASRLGDVEIRSYFTALCDSIGASMIPDRARITLNVAADDSRTTADISVSLGLIVTELVINALKHAFPGRNRGGTITVDYRATGAGWTLSVMDDGIGMPRAEPAPASGLGTSIVAALANQLDAEVITTDENPGCKIAIVHA